MTPNDTTAHTLAEPPMGELVDIGGRRLFVHRTGTGGPPVVILAGASAVGLDYLLIQNDVSAFTTVVSYDRGGTGHSDPLDLPRSAAAVACELRDLLVTCGVEGPYVLVAHSLGGFYAHSFAQQFPHDVAGLVWVDAAYRDWDRYFPPELQLAQAEKIGADPQAMIGMRATLRVFSEQMLAGFPQPLRDALIEAHVSDHWITVGAIERGHQADPAAELQAGPELPNVPLIVLTVTGSDGPQEELVSAEESQMTRDLNAGKLRMDAAVAASVVGGEQRVVSDAGHTEIIFSRPDAVVQAIRDVVEEAGG